MCVGGWAVGGDRYREYLSTRAADSDPQRPDIAAFVASFVRANRWESRPAPAGPGLGRARGIQSGGQGRRDARATP